MNQVLKKSPFVRVNFPNHSIVAARESNFQSVLSKLTEFADLKMLDALIRPKLTESSVSKLYPLRSTISAALDNYVTAKTFCLFSSRSDLLCTSHSTQLSTSFSTSASTVFWITSLLQEWKSTIASFYWGHRPKLWPAFCRYNSRRVPCTTRFCKRDKSKNEAIASFRRSTEDDKRMYADVTAPTRATWIQPIILTIFTPATPPTSHTTQTSSVEHFHKYGIKVFEGKQFKLLFNK